MKLRDAWDWFAKITELHAQRNPCDGIRIFHKLQLNGIYPTNSVIFYIQILYFKSNCFTLRRDTDKSCIIIYT